VEPTQISILFLPFLVLLRLHFKESGGPENIILTFKATK